MAKAIVRSARRTSETLPFWTALQVIIIPFLALMVLPFIFSYLLFSNSFFLLLLNLLLVIVLLMVWFNVSRETLKRHGWQSPEKTLSVAMVTGIIPFMLLTHNFPLPALFLFVCIMQTVLLVKQQE